MARLDDIPEPTRTVVRDIACPSFEATPFVRGGELARRRVALVSSAALIRRGDQPFPVGSGEFRAVPGEWAGSELLMSHVSINFDRAGFQRDINVVFPIDRLRELAADGVIGSVADTHYSVMGSTDPAAMLDTAEALAAALHADRVDTVVLLPV
jgi:D-proline reductase (dithiol) PrdB